MKPEPDITFRAAMHRCAMDIQARRMRGPAAADYILVSYPDT
jgi:hypothetical protein